MAFPETSTASAAKENSSAPKKTVQQKLRIAFRIIIAIHVLLFSALIQWIKENVFGMKPEKSAYLKDNFAPIFDELDARNVPVVGEIPEDLVGQFVRNGPNPRWKPRGQLHWFDGDGMLHAVEFKDGKASYSNRYVVTERFNHEADAEEALFLKIGDWSNALGKVQSMAQIFAQKSGLSKLKGRSTGNTALAFHANRFLALCEPEAPYQVLVPSLETVGMHTFGGKLTTPFTAHPKVDAETGEMFAFGYAFDEPPFVRYYIVNAEGDMVAQHPINLEVPVMMHDFAMTENFVIFMDLPLTFRPERLLSNTESVISFEQNRKSRFGILPRRPNVPDGEDVTSQIQWFEDDSCYVFHTVNAWEDADTVVMVGCRSDLVSSTLFSASGVPPNGYSDEERPFATEFRFNLSTGKVTRKKIHKDPMEFPIIHENFLGRKNDIAYLALMDYDVDIPLLNGVVKIDLNTHEELGRIMYGDKCYGGEAMFVPREASNVEGDGYLLSYVHNEKTNKSELWIMDGTTMDDEPLARVELPRRVPYGFHGKWISPEQLANQRTDGVKRI